MQWQSENIAPTSTQDIAKLVVSTASDWIAHGYRVAIVSPQTGKVVSPCTDYSDDLPILSQAINMNPFAALYAGYNTTGRLTIFEVIDEAKFAAALASYGEMACDPLMWTYGNRKFFACHVPKAAMGEEVATGFGVRVVTEPIPVVWSTHVKCTKQTLQLLARHRCGVLSKNYYELLYGLAPEETQEEDIEEPKRRMTKADMAEQVVLDTCRSLQWVTNEAAYRALMERAYAQLANLRIDELTIANHIQRISDAAIKYGALESGLVSRVAEEIISGRKQKRTGLPVTPKPRPEEGIEIEAEKATEIATDNVLATEIVPTLLYTGCFRVLGDFMDSIHAEVLAHEISRAGLTGEMGKFKGNGLGGDRIIVLYERPSAELALWTRRYCESGAKLYMLKPGTIITEANASWLESLLARYRVVTILDGEMIGSSPAHDRFARWADFVASRMGGLVVVCQQWHAAPRRMGSKVLPQAAICFATGKRLAQARWSTFGRNRGTVGIVIHKDDSTGLMRVRFDEFREHAQVVDHVAELICAVAAATGGKATVAQASEYISVPIFTFKAAMRYAVKAGWVIPKRGSIYELTKTGREIGDKLVQSGISEYLTGNVWHEIC